MRTNHRKRATLAQSGPTGPTTTTQAAVASGDKGHHGNGVSEEDIRLCAYQKWDRAGRPTGDGAQFWLQAEQELRHGK